MNVLSLFDGIGSGLLALKNIGIKIDNYFSSEINKDSIKVANYNHPEIIQLGDINNWENWDIPKIDLLLAGSPCQGFSKAGKGLNFNDERSKLFFKFVEILESLNPKNYLLENNSMKEEYQNIITTSLQKTRIVNLYPINSSLLTTQNRKRLYWTDLNVSEIFDKRLKLNSIIGDYEGIWVYPRGFNKGGVQKYKNKCPTITTSNWEHNFLIQLKNGNKRKFTAEECEKIQTLPVGYTSILSNNKRIKAIGNGWTISVISHIFESLKG